MALRGIDGTAVEGPEALSDAVSGREPGDIISTGTPAGVGIFRDPPITLKPGDVVECAIEGIGAIRNRVVAPE